MNPGEAYISLADFGLTPPKPERMAAAQAHSFTPLLSTFAGDRWRKSSEGIFTHLWASGDNFQADPPFKIRLPAYPAIADEVLRTVVPIIVGAGCPFKVIANTTLLELACSKWSSGEPDGDFVTVYPASQALFDDLTAKLQHAVRGFKSSYTPTPAVETSARMPLTPDTPWPGLDYYLPNEFPYFFGREDEQLELAQRLERTVVTVVLGQPHVGRRSFLRAGLKPSLDRMNYEPVYLHLQGAGAVQPVQFVRDQINRVLTERKINGAPFGEGQTLRDYFHMHQPGWLADGGKPVVPVLVFDQFEDVLAFDETDPAARKPVEALWTQMASMVDNRGRERAGFKVVISLRQDHLPKLLARRGQMPSITQNHFLLKPFNGRKAVQAVLGPGKLLLDPAKADALAEEIIRRVADETTQTSEKPIAAGESVEPLENLRVDTALLNFFCQQLNEARKRSEAGARLITAELVHSEAGPIFEDFLQPEKRAPIAPTATQAKSTIQPREPQPIVQVTEPQPIVQVTEPQPIVQVTEPQPTVQVTEPQPIVQVTEPQPIVQVTEPQPIVQVTEPQPIVQVAEPQPIVQVAEPQAIVQTSPPDSTPQDEPQRPKEEKLDAPGFEPPVKTPFSETPGEHVVRRLKYLAASLGVLLIIILAVMVVTYLEELQRVQTEDELEEYISNNAAAKNTFELAHKKITIAESNLAIEESNLVALTEETREQEQETRAAKEQNSRLAGEQTNFQTRIAQINDERARAEFRLAEWSRLLNDLTNQIASLTRQKDELEARNHALIVTNHALTATNEAKVSNLTPARVVTSNAADEKQALAMETLPERLPAAFTPDIERSSRRNANVLLTHGQCLYSLDGTNFRTLEVHQVLRQGAFIQTGKRSWCDLFIRRTGITVRLAPESEMKIAKLSVSVENGLPVVDTLLNLPYGRLFTIVRALVPGSTLEISDAQGRTVIEGGGLGSYMITAPRPDFGDKLSLTPLRVINQEGTSIIALDQEYSAKDGSTFSLSPSTWETTLIHLDDLEAEADRAIAEPDAAKSPINN
jgi:hypothetical protein